MKSYVLKDVDPELWRKVKMYAYYENVTIREKIIEMLTYWDETYERFEEETRRLNRK